MPDWTLLVAVGIILVILGFFAVAIGMVLYAREEPEEPAHRPREKIRGGGVILIGPIPVVFGTDKRFALIAMALAIVLMLLAIIFLK